MVADYVKYKDEGTSDFLNGANKRVNGCVPRPPKKGEIIKCLVCGELMPPEAFSENPIIRKREFKWQCHNSCMERMFNVCDLETPGLLAQRKNGY